MRHIRCSVSLISGIAEKNHQSLSAAVYEGENIVNVGTNAEGKDVFWGHIEDAQTIYSMDEWNSEFSRWENKKGERTAIPELQPKVRYPTAGLE